MGWVVLAKYDGERKPRYFGFFETDDDGSGKAKAEARAASIRQDWNDPQATNPVIFLREMELGDWEQTQ